jgi:hypothetical protein
MGLVECDRKLDAYWQAKGFLYGIHNARRGGYITRHFPMIAGADNPGSLGTAASASAIAHVGSSRLQCWGKEATRNLCGQSGGFPGPQSSPANNLKLLSEAEPRETIEESQLLSQPINTFHATRIRRG